MSATLQRIKLWGNAVLERWKHAALFELDPRNPDKRRLLSAWGLLLCGGLLFVIGAMFCMMWLKRNQ